MCALQWETCTVLWKLLDKCHFLKAGFLHPSPGREEGKQVQRPGSKRQLDVVREWEQLCLADPEGREEEARDGAGEGGKAGRVLGSCWPCCGV